MSNTEPTKKKRKPKQNYWGKPETAFMIEYINLLQTGQKIPHELEKKVQYLALHFTQGIAYKKIHAPTTDLIAELRLKFFETCSRYDLNCGKTEKLYSYLTTVLQHHAWGIYNRRIKKEKNAKEVHLEFEKDRSNEDEESKYCFDDEIEHVKHLTFFEYLAKQPQFLSGFNKEILSKFLKAYSENNGVATSLAKRPKTVLWKTLLSLSEGTEKKHFLQKKQDELISIFNQNMDYFIENIWEPLRHKPLLTVLHIVKVRLKLQNDSTLDGPLDYLKQHILENGREIKFEHLAKHFSSEDIVRTNVLLSDFVRQNEICLVEM
jgi:hypothetical protein